MKAVTSTALTKRTPDSDPLIVREPKLPAWMGVKGFVDIHCHLLPGLDDGPKTVETARQMAIAAYASGTMAAVATPHCSFRYPFEPAKARGQLKWLETQGPRGFSIFLGCELQLNDESLRLFRDHPADYAINASGYVLVELLPQSAPSNLLHGVRLFSELGYTPILAHPERHPMFWGRHGRLSEWVRNGCLVQITADSLSGRMGRRAERTARALLTEGLVHFVASDGHDPVKRPPMLIEGFRRTAELLGPAEAARLFTYNPLAVLHDQPVPRPHEQGLTGAL